MKVVIVAGMLVALGLFAGAVLASPPDGEGLRVVVPFYLVWAAAVYVAKHPSWPLCTHLPTGRPVCYDQPDTPTAEDHAAQLFLGGSAAIAALGAGAFLAIRRSRPIRAA